MISKKLKSKAILKFRGSAKDFEISCKNIENYSKHNPSIQNKSPFRDLNLNNTYKSFNQMNPTNYRSCYSAVSNKPLELTNKFQFNQMRDEISLIQGKINEIEKKYSINQTHVFKKNHSHLNDQSPLYLNENQHYNTMETDNVPTKIKEVFDNSPLVLNYKYNTQNMKSPIYNDNTRQNSFIDYRQTTTESSIDPYLRKEYKFIINDWKDKFSQLSQEYEKLKTNFLAEKQKNLEFDKLRESLEERNREFSVLKCKLQGAFEEKDQLMYKYHQSESIRIEQSRLIQSLNNEIEKLTLSNKNNTNNHCDKSKEKIENVREIEGNTKNPKEKKKYKKSTSHKKSKSVTKTKK